MSLKPAAWWPEGAPIANQQGRVTAIWLIKFQELLKAVLSALGITGTPVAGNLTVFSSVATITNGDLSGDVTTAGSTVTTIKPDLTLHSLTVTDDIDVTNDANAAVDFWFGSADGVSAPIRVSRIVDATTPVYVEYPGIVSVTEAQSSGNSSGSVDGAYFAAFTSSTDTHNYSFISGTTGDTYHYGSGTVGEIQGHFSDVANAGTGTVNRLIGFEGFVHVDSGTIGLGTAGYARYSGGGTVSTALYGWAVSDAYQSQGPAGKTFPFYFGDITTPSAGIFFVTENGYVRTPALTLPPTTVALLPSAPLTGMSATVSDALAPVAGTPVAGGGAVFAEVLYNGANWLVSAGTGAVGTVTHTGTLTNHALIVGDGGADVSALGSLGTTTTVLHGNASGAPTFGAVALGTDVSGTLLAAQFPALAGDVTTAAGSLTTTIAAAAVTLAKMANLATQTLIGRNTAGAGTPEAVTISQALDWL